MSKPTLSDLPPRYQAQALEQLQSTPRPRTVAIEPVPPVPVSTKRIRQNSAGLNKTEAAFLAQLRADADGLGDIAVLAPQSLTLRLANGVRYTPDFVTVETVTLGASVRAYEVKGYMRDDAAVKLKVAASQYPWIKFHLVTRRKDGAFSVEEVLS